MQDFEQQGDGLPPESDALLRAEIERALLNWGESYKTVRLELPITVVQILMQHISEKEGLEAYVDFCEQAGDILQGLAASIKKVLYDDCMTTSH